MVEQTIETIKLKDMEAVNGTDVVVLLDGVRVKAQTSLVISKANESTKYVVECLIGLGSHGSMCVDSVEFLDVLSMFNNAKTIQLMFKDKKVKDEEVICMSVSAEFKVEQTSYVTATLESVENKKK